MLARNLPDAVRMTRLRLRGLQSGIIRRRRYRRYKSVPLVSRAPLWTRHRVDSP